MTDVKKVKEGRVYVVDDDQDFRESLVWLLEAAGHRVIGFDSAEAFLAELDAEGFDETFSAGPAACLLLDVRMAGMSGLALQQKLNERTQSLPVIMMTGHGDVAMAVQAMKNRAVDFIEKPFDDEVLLGLVAETLAAASAQCRQQDRQQQVAQRWQLLSKRERQVAELVVVGKVNRETATELGISIKTVEIHRSRVMSKLQVKNLAELVSLVAGL